MSNTLPPTDPITKEQMENALTESILNDFKEVNEIVATLRHGEAKRLLLAELMYPQVDEDFSHDTTEMQRALAACKRIKDAMVAKTAEYVIEQLMKQQEKENNNG